MVPFTQLASSDRATFKRSESKLSRVTDLEEDTPK